MKINGLELPTAFVQDLQNGKFERRIGFWELKRNVDVFGNHLETELGYVYENSETILHKTNDLPQHFTPYASDDPDESADEPRFIPYITDFSKIICFGLSGDGADFCFDYRKDLITPSVIWWDDVYWRQIAPDYNSFVELFDFNASQ